MKFLKDFLGKQEQHFVKGGKLEKLYPLYEATESFIFTPGKATRQDAHVRDVMDLKRVMMTVVIALVPAIMMALYNTGYKANLMMQKMGMTEIPNWRGPITPATRQRVREVTRFWQWDDAYRELGVGRAYASAAAEVASIEARIGRDGLLELIRRAEAGERFDQVLVTLLTEG